jgi:hypothetical protein
MSDMTTEQNEQAICFETFGVSIAVTADPSLLPRLEGLAPVPSRPCDPATAKHRISVRAGDEGRFTLHYDLRDGEVPEERDYSQWLMGDADIDLAIASLDAHLQSIIGLYAPNHTFINAGVVAHRDGAILLLGGSLTGKSTLVAELVNAGCTHYSDDYAVLDEEGLVHPYLRPTLPGSLHPAGSNGGPPEPAAGGALAPLRIGAVVMTTYWPGAEWAPRRLSPGEAVLALVSAAEAGSERPEKTFQAITVALKPEPVALQGNRGEAATVAPLLLAQLERELQSSGAA